MAGFGDIVQKAFYLGVGLASYAGEKAGTTLADLRVQAQKLADEMVARGEMTAEDARRMVDEMVARAQVANPPEAADQRTEPRRIEILSDDEPEPSSNASASKPAASGVDDLKDQVTKLQEELRRLRRE